jgi:hypothetical protein
MSRKHELDDHLRFMGSLEQIAELVQNVIWDNLRDEFNRLLSGEYRTAKEDFEILNASDQAVRNVKGQK